MLIVIVIVVAALLGALLGGVAGFVIGGLIGGVFGFVMVGRSLRRVREQFIETTFSVMGALCKADGVVTRAELDVVERIWTRLHLTPEQKEAAKTAFKRGKAPGFDLDGTVREFARLAPPGSAFFQLFLQLQRTAINADGELHPTEQAMLMRVARLLGLSEHDLAQLEALLRSATQTTSTRDCAPSSKSPLENAYVALGVSATASEADIRAAYRKVIRENHPDRLASKGLPESMRVVAEERTRELNAAFDQIKKARQFA
ncbi:MAG TPA: co-chaperone DjlA [Polyangiaceae bacterium]|nr:co-chaperone DjlA [Polyangiaceae bacterium]